MGWKQFNGEVILKQGIRVGSTQSVIPDIIVRSKADNVSFVIEVKKPSIPITDNNRNQLFSYMRLLQLEFGVLFGDQIQIFYDGQYNAANTPACLKLIEFNNNEENLDFIKIFKKGALSKEALSGYAKKEMNVVNSKKEMNELTTKILSLEFSDEVKKQVKLMLLNNWDECTVDNVMKETTIAIKRRTENTQILTEPTHLHYAGYPIGEVKYVFDPADENTFKTQLVRTKRAHIKIFYKDGREEYKPWNASRFTMNSGLRGNINSKTWFRRDYIERNGVVKAIFSIDPIEN